MSCQYAAFEQIFTILQEYITLFESYDGSDVIKTGEPRSLPQPKRYVSIDVLLKESRNDLISFIRSYLIVTLAVTTALCFACRLDWRLNGLEEVIAKAQMSHQQLVHIVTYFIRHDITFLSVLPHNYSRLRQFARAGKQRVDLYLADRQSMSLFQSDDIQVHTITPPYGKGFMKKQRISPDGYIQMCMQLAYYRMHKGFAKTYEPSTAR